MRKPKSKTMGAVHEMAKGLHKAGVMDKKTMGEFDRLCLSPAKPKKSKVLEHVHEGAKDLLDMGVIDRAKMDEFDRLCLPSVKSQKLKHAKKTKKL